jgi:hypothetical protein
MTIMVEIEKDYHLTGFKGGIKMSKIFLFSQKNANERELNSR